MSKLPSLKPREIAEILRKAGFIEDVSKSSHRVFRNSARSRTTVLSFHPGTIPQGTLRAIISQSGMTVDEFLSLRKKSK